MMKDPLCGVEVPVCWEEHLSRAEILGLLKIAHRKFYMRPKFVARQVLGLETGSELKRLAQGALSLVKLELLNSKSRTAPVSHEDAAHAAAASGLVLALGLGMAPRASGQDDTPAPAPSAEENQAWSVKLARMEGASVNVQEAALATQDSARRIASSGRITGLSDLLNDSIELNRRVVSLRLATEVLTED